MDDLIKEGVRFKLNEAIKKVEGYQIESQSLNPIIFIVYFAFVIFVIFKMYQK